MGIEQKPLRESLERIKKSFVWFCLTLIIGLVPTGIFWLIYTIKGISFTFEDFILRGDILAFSIVLMSSLAWDYVILVEKSEETLLEIVIFYGLPLVTIPFIVATYVLCLLDISSEHDIQMELIVLFQFWILALTAIYAILTKLAPCKKRN